MSTSNVSNVVNLPRAEMARTASEMLEDVADKRVWLARHGVPGVYVVYPDDNMSLYFLVTSFFDLRRGRMVIRVFPVSCWQAGACLESFPLPEKGVRTPFLPPCVLWGSCDFDRLPESFRGSVLTFIDDVLDGIDYYDEMHPRRPRSQRSN